MHAAALLAQEWPFDVDAEQAGNAAQDAFAHRADAARHHGQIVADQRGQETGGAEAAMRAADGFDAGDAGIVVEQHAAAAVHLGIDESGDQQLLLEIDDAIDDSIRTDHFARADPRLDAPVVHQQRLAALNAGVGQNPSVLECNPHQVVSVTLWRCGGRSGSRPRASASAFAMP